MVPTSISFRTLHIKYNGGTGTCFIYDHKGRQYFITARHVIESLKTGETVGIYYNKRWSDHKVTMIGHSSDADISVFAVPGSKTGGESIEATSEEMYYSQDVYFLGFPFGLQSEIKELNDDFPIPFVKKAILSNFLLEGKRKILLLDGHNNPGFSGGPVVYLNVKKGVFQLAGIISGYRAETRNAQVKNVDIDVQYQTNTGIIIAYGIKSAIDLIESNPIGEKI